MVRRDAYNSQMYPLSARMKHAKPSFVREILKVANRADIISFAGGLPAPELFDVDGIRDATALVFEKSSTAALQYGPTDGVRSFKAQVSELMGRRGVNDVKLEELIVTTGSQQGIDLIAKVMLDPGDVVLVERPAYLAAVQVFELYEAELRGVDSDADGLNLESLELEIAALKKQGKRPKFIYTVATFGNPSGATLSLERRHKLLEIAAREQILLLEDDPYCELRFSGESLPPVIALADEAQRPWIVYMSTLSKFVAPGLRLGWMIVPDGLVQALTIAKQAADLHTSTFNQHVAAAYLETGRLEAALPRIREAYGVKAKAMMDALNDSFPAGTLEFNQPEGGMFLWAKMAEGVDTFAFVKTAVDAGVIFVPGITFFPDAKRLNYLRLSFATPSVSDIQEGVKRLVRAVVD
jgi:2-aminoadipate transaminase